MPKGYVITKWDDDEGLDLVANYPKRMEIDLDDMMRIFYAHITGKGEAGYVMVRLQSTRTYVYSYFNGMTSKKPFMISLMLDVGEDPEIFGESLLHEINLTIDNYINSLSSSYAKNSSVISKLEDYLARATMLLERLKNLTRSQTLAQIYSSEKGRALLELLRDGPKSRRNMQILIEERLDKSVANLEIIIDLLAKTNLVEQDWIEGVTDIFTFLKDDFVILRTPAKKIIERARKKKIPAELAKKYLEKVKEFYANYQPRLNDTFKVANNIINPDKFDFIALFREKEYPLEKLPQSPEETVLTVKEIIQLMVEDNILTIIEDSNKVKWVFLLSDVAIDTFFPEYLIEKTRQDYEKGYLSKELAFKQIKYLEKSYQLEVAK